ncbi:MAG: DNRLRE domain-containing protein [Phycisphaerae bacterium]
MTRSSLPWRLLLTVAVPLLVLAGRTSAAVVFDAIEDNNVFRGQATTVQTNGTNFSLKEASSDQTNTRIGYLKFDLSTLTDDDGDNGVLTVTTAGATTTEFVVAVFALVADAPLSDWTESGVTWNSRPAVANSSPSTNYLDPTYATALHELTIPSGTATNTPFSFAIPDVKNFRQDDGSVTLMVVVTDQLSGTPSLAFHSSETTTAGAAPALSVSVPEPGALGAVGLAAALIGRRRR